MNDLVSSSASFGVVISLLAFYVGTLLKKKFKLGIFNPLLIAIILTVAFLLVFKIDYENYYASAKYLSWLLTPATVSLAIPLYIEIVRVKKII